MDAFIGRGTLLGQVIAGPSGLFGYDDMWNRPEVLAAELPSSNGVGTARAVARHYALLIGEVDGRRLLSPATVERATELQVSGPDRVIGMPMAFGLEYMTPPPGAPPRAFGHAGAGGSLGVADPGGEWSLGYVMNQMQLGRRRSEILQHGPDGGRSWPRSPPGGLVGGAAGGVSSPRAPQYISRLI